jgi:hypothetical protein
MFSAMMQTLVQILSSFYIGISRRIIDEDFLLTLTALLRFLKKYMEKILYQ